MTSGLAASCTATYLAPALSRLRPAFLISHEFLEFTMPIFTRDDDDAGYRPGAFESVDGMRDHRFAGDIGKKLIETHSTAAPGCDKDGG
jgi:hypothetical protein